LLISVFNDRTAISKNSQFDFILDQTASQRKLYDRAGIPDLVHAVVDGYHATVFAYGQTGSGKSYTMEGYKYKVNEKGVPVPVITEYKSFEKTPPSHMMDNDGVVPRAIHHLFDLIKQQTNLQKKKFTVYCSYLQVYKEKIYDLLNKATLKRL
jgi:Kinesin motor domain